MPRAERGRTGARVARARPQQSLRAEATHAQVRYPLRRWKRSRRFAALSMTELRQTCRCLGCVLGAAFGPVRCGARRGLRPGALCYSARPSARCVVLLGAAFGPVRCVTRRGLRPACVVWCHPLRGHLFGARSRTHRGGPANHRGPSSEAHMKTRARRWLWAVVPLGLSLLECTSTKPKAEREDDIIIGVFPKAEVHGSLYLGRKSSDDVGGIQGGTSKIFVPDLLVALKQTSSGTTVATTKTDLGGHCYFRKQFAGSYQVCWAGPGFAPGCSAPFTLGSQTAYPGMLPVATSGNTVVGKATLSDGRPCYAADAFFQINLFGRVTLVDAASGADISAPIRSNTEGYYILSGFSGSAASGHKVRVRCEKAVTDATVASSHLLGTALDLTLPNASPKIQTVVARLGGRGVRSALLGSFLDAQADTSDGDGHAVHYMWRTEGGGTLPNVDAATAPWMLPSETGRAVAYVVAYDGYGGYAEERIPIAVREKAEVLFEGTVIDDTTRAPIFGAEVSVHGASVDTDSSGHFQLRTAEDTSDRYVLNVRKVGYALLSQIYTADNIGGIYELQRAKSKPLDPTLGIDIVDGRDDQKRRLYGARVIIPPDSMTSSGPLTGYIATLDPSRKPIPGDYRAVNSLGNETNLASYGTTFAEFRDASGNLVNVAPGKKATVRFAVPPSHAPTAPPTIPIWSYEEEKGIWIEESKAVLISTPDGPMYEGTTSHFSTLNTDIEKGPNAKCLRVRVDPTQIPAGIKLRVHVPTAPAAQQVQEMTLDADEYHAIYRLPDTGIVTLEVIDSLGNLVPGASQNIDMATRPALMGGNLWPPYP